MGLFAFVGLDHRILRQHNMGAAMARVADHLSVTELQAGYRGSKDATLARHYQVIWLLAHGGRDGAADGLCAALG